MRFNSQVEASNYLYRKHTFKKFLEGRKRENLLLYFVSLIIISYGKIWVSMLIQI